MRQPGSIVAFRVLRDFVRKAKFILANDTPVEPREWSNDGRSPHNFRFSTSYQCEHGTCVSMRALVFVLYISTNRTLRSFCP
jgi:hypothetical protein